MKQNQHQHACIQKSWSANPLAIVLDYRYPKTLTRQTPDANPIALLLCPLITLLLSYQATIHNVSSSGCAEPWPGTGPARLLYWSCDRLYSSFTYAALDISHRANTDHHAVLIVGARVYARTAIVRNFGKDDWAMLTALVSIFLPTKVFFVANEQSFSLLDTSLPSLSSGKMEWASVEPH
jgi:hypothetical protein